jgi:hypothetical protein
MPARFGEPERFQPRLDVLGISGRLVLSHPSTESSGGDGAVERLDELLLFSLQEAQIHDAEITQI